MSAEDVSTPILPPAANSATSIAEDGREAPVLISQLLGPTRSTPPRINLTCDDTVLRGLGVCVDDKAGAQPFALPNSSEMPAGLEARSLDIQSDERAAVITTPRARDGLIIFEYRVAHRQDRTVTLKPKPLRAGTSGSPDRQGVGLAVAATRMVMSMPVPWRFGIPATCNVACYTDA